MSPNDNKTYSPKPGDLTRDWHVIDASDVVLGRLAVQVATLLRGKHKPTFAPHMDGGDFVVVVNASKISLGGSKGTDKMYHRHSGRPGGLKSVPANELLARDPRKVVLTGGKSEQKVYHHHSGFPGGLKTRSFIDLVNNRPQFIIEKAVKGMLPHTRLGRQMASKLKVYAGPTHPHLAQQPVPFEINQVAQ